MVLFAHIATGKDIGMTRITVTIAVTGCIYNRPFDRNTILIRPKARRLYISAAFGNTYLKVGNQDLTGAALLLALLAINLKITANSAQSLSDTAESLVFIYVLKSNAIVAYCYGQ